MLPSSADHAELERQLAIMQAYQNNYSIGFSEQPPHLVHLSYPLSGQGVHTAYGQYPRSLISSR